MKLLFALPGFHRYDRGAEIALLAVAAELARTGDEVTVAGSGKPRADSPYTFRRLPALRRETFERFPKFPPMRSETAWEDASFAAALISQMPLSGFDATLTCSFPFTHWALRRRGQAGPAHIFVTQNGDWPAWSNQSEYRFFHCDGLICTNPDYLRRNQGRWRSKLVANGVDVERFRPGLPERDRFGLPSDKHVVLMVSALVESKRVLDGIRAVAQIDRAFLAVAGDGPLRQEAKDLADRLMPNRYAQLAVPVEDMPSLYRSADVFLHLSLMESFGNVFLEAWASGLPIVAHESERLRWIVGDGHLLCDSSDPAELIHKLREALFSKSAMSSAGLERFAWSNIAAQYREFIADLT